MKISCSNWPIDILSRTIRDRDHLIMLRDRELSSFLGPFYPSCHCNDRTIRNIIVISSLILWRVSLGGESMILKRSHSPVYPTLITSDIGFLWTKCEAAIISSLGNGFCVPRWREKKTLAIVNSCFKIKCSRWFGQSSLVTFWESWVGTVIELWVCVCL